MTYGRKQKDDKMEDKLSKTEMNGERAMDEIFFIKEQLKHVQEERKKDVDDTANYIKQMI